MLGPARIVAELLVRGGVVQRPGLQQRRFDYRWPVYVSAMPDDPEQCVAVMDSAGRIFGRDQRTGKTDRHRGVHLEARSTDPEVGESLMATVVAFLEGIASPPPLLAGGLYYHVHTVYLTSDVISLGQEKGTRRYLWSLNARLVMKDVETTKPETP